MYTVSIFGWVSSLSNVRLSCQKGNCGSSSSLMRGHIWLFLISIFFNEGGLFKIVLFPVKNQHLVGSILSLVYLATSMLSCVICSWIVGGPAPPPALALLFFARAEFESSFGFLTAKEAWSWNMRQLIKSVVLWKQKPDSQLWAEKFKFCCMLRIIHKRFFHRVTFKNIFQILKLKLQGFGQPKSRLLQQWIENWN